MIKIKLITLMINTQQDVPINEMRILTSRFDLVIYKFSVQRLRFPVFDHGNHQCRRAYNWTFARKDCGQPNYLFRDIS